MQFPMLGKQLASHKTTTLVDITRPRLMSTRSNSPQEWQCNSIRRINRGHSCSKQQRAHYSTRWVGG